MIKKSLKKNALLNIVRTTCGIIYPIITFPYASRILLPEGIGKVNFANSVISYFVLIAGLGIGTYGTREAAKIRENKIALSNLVKELFTINIISMAIAYLLLGISLFLVPKFQSYQTLLLISSITILFTTIGFDWVYSALEEYGYITLRTIIFQCISIVLLFLLVKTKEDYAAYLGIGVISSVGANVLNCIHLRKYIILKTGYKLQIKQHLKPIFVLFGMALVTSVYTMLDTTMLGFLADDTQVGYYSAATKLNKMVLGFVTAACAVLFPRLSLYAAKENKEEFRQLLNKSLAITMCFAIPATIGLSILSEPITLLFSGENYLPSVPVMRMMNPIIIIIALSNFIGIQCLIPLHKEKITLYSVCVGAGTNFILNIILIPHFGALGAAIATLCAESSVTIFQLIAARKYINIAPIFKAVIEYIISSIFMGIAVYLCTQLNMTIVAKALLPIPIGIFVYACVLLILKNQTALYIIHYINNKIRNRK